MNKNLQLTADEIELISTLIKYARQINEGSGFGKITIQIAGKRVLILRSEETHFFEKEK